MQRFSKFGLPLRPPTSRLTTLIIRPDVGYRSNAGHPTNLQPGETFQSQTMLMQDGAITLRPTLTNRTANSNPLGGPVQGGTEIISSAGTHYPFVSSTTRFAWYSNGSWSALSFTSAYGLSIPPANASTDYWDVAQIYFDQPDEICAVVASSSYQTLYVWHTGTIRFSQLTGAPQAKYVAGFDNYLLAFNTHEAGLDLPQRVRWTQRGSCSSWTGADSAGGYFEDLLDMKGVGTRILAEEGRVVLFSNHEIWQGYRTAIPFTFSFSPLDRTVGCSWPWTITQTPLGTMFLDNNFQLYLLPKGGGGSPVRIGDAVAPEIRNTINQPARSWGVYDPATATYQLHYVTGSATYPRKALWLNVETGAWSPQAYDPVGNSIEVSRGFEATFSSTATTWSAQSTTGLSWAQIATQGVTWEQMLGVTDQRKMLVGASAGTMYYQDSQGTRDDTVVVPWYWGSHAQFGEIPEAQKTVIGVRLDYQTNSRSTVTVKVSPDQGASYPISTGVNLPATSYSSQAKADIYLAARYPVVRLEGEGTRPKIQRVQVAARIQGR